MGSEMQGVHSWREVLCFSCGTSHGWEAECTGSISQIKLLRFAGVSSLLKVAQWGQVLWEGAEMRQGTCPPCFHRAGT